MSSGKNRTITAPEPDDEFPVAAIVCLAVGGYVILVIIILIIRYKLTSAGRCKSDCCSSEEAGCCTGCCVRLSEACPCCCSTSADGFLSRICGKRKKMTCVDFFGCNCCGCTEGFCDSCSCPAIHCSNCGGGGSCCEGASCHCHPSCAPCLRCCTACRGSCANCCYDPDKEPGTCACLCLEIRFRSSKGNATHLNNASAHVYENRQFNTHTPVQKHIGTFGSGDGDSGISASGSFNQSCVPEKNHQRSKDTTLRHRSASESPVLSQKKIKFNQLSVPNTNANNSHRVRSKRELPLRNGKSTRQVDPLDLNNHSTSSPRSSSLSDDSPRFLSQSGRALIHKTDKQSAKNKQNDSKMVDSNSKLNRQSRRTSQRFPNTVLVTRESLKLSLSAGSATLSTQRSGNQSSRALPVPHSSRT